mmetsp:Transcript_10333/g.25991  ORF Transcript_10333/g.25991 Transcript_10333/m.25991 type:complete len:205 (-) Transcript_10333:436-1050(-)
MPKVKASLLKRRAQARRMTEYRLTYCAPPPGAPAAQGILPDSPLIAPPSAEKRVSTAPNRFQPANAGARTRRKTKRILYYPPIATLTTPAACLATPVNPSVALSSSLSDPKLEIRHLRLAGGSWLGPQQLLWGANKAGPVQPKGGRGGHIVRALRREGCPKVHQECATGRGALLEATPLQGHDRPLCCQQQDCHAGKTKTLMEI